MIKLTSFVERCKVDLIEGNATPTDVIGARRFAAINKMVINSNQLKCFVGIKKTPFNIKVCYNALKTQYSELVLYIVQYVLYIEKEVV